MIQGVNSTSEYSVHFSVCTDDVRGLLWLEVTVYEPRYPRTFKQFAGNEYGKALEYYNRRQKELKEQYGM